MRIRRRTAVWIGVAVVVLSLAGAGWRMTRPEYLRKELLALGQGALAEGWEIEVDAVDFDLLDGIARVKGVRLVRTEPRAVVVDIPAAEAEISFSALFGRGRLASELRITKPEITLERGADGEIPLFHAFRTGGGGGPTGWPRVQVADGVVRLLDRALLAEGEAIVLAVRSLTVEESRDGDPSGISGELEEKGSPKDGTGALGPVHLSGEIPWGKAGLRVVVDSFEVGEPLQRRLSKAVRENLAPLRRLGGTFGDGTDRGLEVLLTKAPGGTGTVVQVTARPRGLEVDLRDHPYALAGITGDVSWNSGTKRVDVRRFHLFHSGATFQAEGFLDHSGPEPLFEVRFGARGLQLDKELYDAYPPSLRKVWDTYAFHGTVDIGAGADQEAGSLKSYLRRTREGGPLELDITAQLTGAGLSYKGVLRGDGVRHGFDWPVDRVIGEVSVKAPVDDGGTSILLQGIRGRHGDTEVSAEGSVMDWGDRSMVDITLHARDVHLDDSVRNCSPIIAGLFDKFGPEGRLSDLQVHIAQEAIPGAPTLATVVGEFDGKGGMTWEGLPLKVEGLSGTVAYRERLIGGKKAVITEISGVKGTTPEGAEVFADGTVEGEGDASELRLQVRARAILLDGLLEDAVRGRKKENEIRLWDNLRPSGPVDLVVDVAGTSAGPALSVTANLRGAYLRGWGEVDFPVADLTGTVTVKDDDLELRSVRGMHDGREVTLSGGVRDLGGAATFDLTLKTAAFPLDESARGILGPKLSETLAGYFTTVRPAAGLEGDVAIRLLGEGSALDPEVVVENLRGGAAPFDLRNLVFAGGTVRYAGGAISIENLLGTMGDRELRIPRGALRFDRGEGSLTVEVRRLRFPADLVGLIPADTAAAIEEVVPGRFIHFEGLEVVLSDHWRRVEMSGAVSLSPQKEGATGGLGLEGTFRLDRFTLLRGEAEGDPTAISGGIDITRGALDAGVRARDLAGRLQFGGSVGHLGRGIEGTLSGMSARIEGRELRDAGGEIYLRDGVFLVQGLRGVLAGGDIGITVEVGGQRAFEGVVTLSNARAREFFAPADPDSKVQGQVDATLRFRMPRGTQSRLVGDGQVSIKKGTLLKVPVFDRLYSLLQISDPPEFTAGQIVFAILGDKMTFSKVDLDSSVIGIHLARGRSAAYMDGRLDLKLLPEFKTGGLLWAPFDLASAIVRPIFERMYTIYVRGTVQRPEVSFEILPGLFAGDLKDGPVLLTPPPAYAVEPRAPWDF